MRNIVKDSKRELTARSLVVDWHGHGYLIYRMSKAQVKDAFKGGDAVASESLNGRLKTVLFPVRRFPSGSIAIGCEYFTKAEVAELKKWIRA